MNGLFDDDHLDVWQDEIQTDYNGSAKIALIEIDRSLMAMEILRKIIDEGEELLPLMVRLQKIRTGLERTFPLARKFHRPGFDD